MSVQSSLARHVAPNPSTDLEVREKCRRAWHANGTVCLRGEWLGTWADRKLLEQMAKRVFGKRRTAR